MHQNNFRRKFIIFITCSVFFHPSLAEIEVCTGQLTKIIVDLPEKRIHIAGVMLFSFLRFDNVRHIPPEIPAYHERTFMKLPTVGKIKSYTLILIFRFRNSSLCRIIFFICIWTSLYFRLISCHISSVIIEIACQVIISVMESRHMFIVFVNHILIDCIFIFSVPSVPAVHIMTVAVGIGMGKIQIIGQIVTPIQVIPFPPRHIIIHACRTSAGGVGDVVYASQMVINVSHTEFISSLDTHCIVLLPVVTNPGLNLRISFPFGNDIDNAAACFRTIQYSTATTNDFNFFYRICGYILQLIHAALIHRHSVNEHKCPFFDATNNRFSKHSSL